MAVDFIPRQDAAFEVFFRNLVTYVLDNYKRWGHIPQEDVGQLENQYTDWSEAYEVTLRPHLPQLTLEKNRVRKASERGLRAFINRFLRWPPVTDLDRDKMGVRNPDVIRTPHFTVEEVVELELSLRNIRQVIIDFWIKGETTTKAKPPGYDGAVLVWEILDEPPRDIHDLTQHTMASRTPHALIFTEPDRGKTVYIAAAWQNERGYIGNWSEIVSAIIP